MINTTKIAKSNLKQNKSKSILIITTILLATALLSVVAMSCVDWNESNKERVRAFSGTQHGVYSNMYEKNIEEIKAHSDIEKIGLVNVIGVKKYEDGTKISITYVDENALNFNSIKIVKGKAPINKNEIVLDDLALEKLGYSQEIGQKIKLDYDDFGKEDTISGEFILTGITETSKMGKVKKSLGGLVSKEYMISSRDMSKENYNVFIGIKDFEKLSGEELKSKVDKVAKDLEIAKGRVIINEDYINTLKPDSEIMMWGVTISAVVILCSILVIYNIFYLSIVTKVQEFGKLRAIGATKKQIKSIVFKEGMFLSLIAIPMGVILGYVVNEYILGSLLYRDTNTSKLPISIGVMIISLITVFVSLIKPMNVASKVSIVDAIRYNGEDKDSNKTRKGYDNINLKRLAYAGLKRNKKRTYITILSLSLSGIIFIVMASFMNSIDAEKRARLHFPQDIQVRIDGYTFGEEDSPNTELNMLQMNNPVGKDFKEQIMNIDGVTKIDESKSLKVELKGYSAGGKYRELAIIDKDDLEELDLYLTSGKYCDLDSVEEGNLEELELYLEEGKIDLEKLKSGKEIIFNYPELAKELGIKAGDKVTLVLYDGDKKIEKEFKIQAITIDSGTFGIHNDAFEKLVNTDTTDSVGIYVDENKYESVKEYIKNLDKSSDYIRAGFIDESIKSFEFSIESTNAMGYGLVVVIGVIGFMNLINSMITSIITRKKELGMLQAIGLTDKQLVKMLNIEAMFYTGTMLITSLTLGSGLGYIAVQVFRRFGGSYAIYTFPIVQVCIMVICIVIAQLTLTYLISKNFNKQSLIDRVRYSE